MRTSQKQNNANKQNEDLRAITHTLFMNWIKVREKYKDDNFVMDLKELMYKIADVYFVSPSKAKEYLNLLECRGVLRIDNDLVIYNHEKVKDMGDYLNKINKK